MKKSKIVLLFAALGLLMLVAACTAVSDDSSDIDQSLPGTSWYLIGLDGKELPSDAPEEAEKTITLFFDNATTASGSTSCNGYNATYTAEGNNISFGENIAMTQKLCPTPLMELQAAYMMALMNTQTYEISGETLTFFGADGEELALFTKQSK